MASIDVTSTTVGMRTRLQRRNVTTQKQIRGDYTMKVGKAIDKKKQATNRPDFTYKPTPGGHVFTLNAGIFEDMKNSLSSYFDQLNFVRQDGTDKNGSIHTITYKAPESHTDQYSVNFFLTTSRIVSNGVNSDVFVTLLKDTAARVDRKYAEHINSIFKSASCEINSARRSSRPRKQTEKASLSLQQSRSRTAINKTRLIDNPPPRQLTKYITPVITPIDTEHFDARMGQTTTEMRDDEDAENDDTGDCPVCIKMVEADTRALACDFCEQWVHMKCDANMTLELYREHTSDKDLPYVCPVCVLNLDAKYQSPNHLPTITELPTAPAIQGTKPSSDEEQAERTTPPSNQPTVELATKQASDNPAELQDPAPSDLIDHAPPDAAATSGTNIPADRGSTPDPSTSTPTATLHIRNADDPSHNPDNAGQDSSQSMTDEEQSFAKQLEQKRKELQKWEDKLRKQCSNNAEAAKELTAARILISKLEYELKQERHAKRVQADLLMSYQNGSPSQPTVSPPVQNTAPSPPAPATTAHTSTVPPYQQQPAMTAHTSAVPPYQQQPASTYPTGMPHPTHPYQIPADPTHQQAAAPLPPYQSFQPAYPPHTPRNPYYPPYHMPPQPPPSPHPVPHNNYLEILLANQQTVIQHILTEVSQLRSATYAPLVCQSMTSQAHYTMQPRHSGHATYGPPHFQPTTYGPPPVQPTANHTHPWMRPRQDDHIQSSMKPTQENRPTVHQNHRYHQRNPPSHRASSDHPNATLAPTTDRYTPTPENVATITNSAAASGSPSGDLTPLHEKPDIPNCMVAPQPCMLTMPSVNTSHDYSASPESGPRVNMTALEDIDNPRIPPITNSMGHTVEDHFLERGLTHRPPT